jgi:hypothetical protein
MVAVIWVRNPARWRFDTQSQCKIQRPWQIPWFEDLRPQLAAKIGSITSLSHVNAEALRFRQGDREGCRCTVGEMILGG